MNKYYSENKTYSIYRLDKQGYKVTVDYEPSFKTVKHALRQMILNMIYQLDPDDEGRNQSYDVYNRKLIELSCASEDELRTQGITIPDELDADSNLVDPHGGTTYYIN